MAVRRLTIRPAEVPRFAEGEYHPDQATRYIELTSFIHRALHLPSIHEFTEGLAEIILSFFSAQRKA